MKTLLQKLAEVVQRCATDNRIILSIQISRFIELVVFMLDINFSSFSYAVQL